MLDGISKKKLTHVNTQVLTTLMAEASAIVNARPLVPVSNDPDVPEILTPAMLLTQKTQPLRATAGKIDGDNLYGEQWKRVQHLANTFGPRRRK